MRSRFSITAIFCILFLITGVFSAFAADPVVISDDTEFVGHLKILARYNDSMQFYDGHTYLLFTSYQDGVTITMSPEFLYFKATVAPVRSSGSPSA